MLPIFLYIVSGLSTPDRIEGPSIRDATVVEVEIERLSFGRAEVRVAVGSTVRWRNLDLVPHTVTPDGSAAEWGSGLIAPGGIFEHTFEASGTYTYHCSPHPFMTSRVIVAPPAP